MSTPARTNAILVQAILQDNYKAGVDLTPFITAATTIVDRVATGAAAKCLPLTTSELELIERWLAAHFYCVNDPLYMSKSTGGASGNFQRGAPTEGFQTTDYGRQAVALDYSGVLNAIGKRSFASAVWLGKPPSEQIPYTQRD